MGVGGVEVVAAIVIAAAAAAAAAAAEAATWISAKGLGGRRPVPELRLAHRQAGAIEVVEPRVFTRVRRLVITRLVSALITTATASFC